MLLSSRPYRVVSDDPLVVELTATGGRFTPVSPDAWAAAVERWRQDVRRWDRRLERIYQWAQARDSIPLYERAARAARRRQIPCPLPEGHLMFAWARRRKAARGAGRS